MSAFRYTHAIVCRIPDSINKAIGVEEPIELPKCRRQHEMYVQSLRDAGIDVIELPADEQQPDGAFVEDTAIVCNGTALLCRPQNTARRQEVKYMQSILKRELELPVMEISDEAATLEGGDVLFTGREFFVGVSERSNHAGAVALANAFPEFPCSPIKLEERSPHLKSFLSMAGPDVLCVAKDGHAQEALKRIESCASFTYKTVTVPDAAAANCVFLNGCLLHRSDTDFPDSAKVITGKLSHYKLRGLEFGELNKAWGSLSRCSILLRRPRILRSIP